MIEHNKQFYLRLMIQGTCAVVFMYLVLLSLDMIRATNLIWAAGASTLASSTFIVFGKPDVRIARPFLIIIGYMIAMLCGHIIRIAADEFCSNVAVCHMGENSIRVHEVAAVLALGLTFLLMAFLRCAHPPAAGLAVVMVLDISNPWAMLVIMAGALVLSGIRVVFQNRLKPLI